MAETMTPSAGSKTTTDGQIVKAVATYRALLEKHRQEFDSEAAQTVLGQAELASEMLAVVRKRVEAVMNPVLRPLARDLVLDPTDGLGMIGGATKVFTNYIDPDFKNYGCNVTGQATRETKVVLHEMVQDATFAQIFGSFGVGLDQLCLTQDQIIQFCVRHHHHLRSDGYATFFLFKVGNAFFVVDVLWRGGRELLVYVRRLTDDGVWNGEYCHWVVVQLTPVALPPS